MNIKKRLGALKTTNNKAIFWMIVGGFDFATMGALIHALGDECDWLILAFFRMFISFILAFFLTRRAGLKPFLIDRPLLWLRSLVGCAAMIATFYALTELPISDVAVITESRPIWVAIMAGFLLGETTGKRVWLSIILGMTGVVLVEHAHINDGNFAGLAAFLAAIAGAFVMILLRKLRDVDPRTIVAHFAGTASLVCLILIIILGKKFDLAFIENPVNMLMLAGIGVFGTIGQLAMTKAFSIGEAPGVASAGFIRVGFSAGYDVLIWQHSFQLTTLLGVGLILGSTGGLFKTDQGGGAVRTAEKDDDKEPQEIGAG